MAIDATAALSSTPGRSDRVSPRKNSFSEPIREERLVSAAVEFAVAARFQCSSLHFTLWTSRLYHRQDAGANNLGQPGLPGHDGGRVREKRGHASSQAIDHASRLGAVSGESIPVDRAAPPHPPRTEPLGQPLVGFAATHVSFPDIMLPRSRGTMLV